MNFQKTVAVIGSGMGALTTACLLAKQGLQCTIFEQNYLPGGCTSSYWRKGFVFESGATTLVGLDKNMPLRYLLDEIGIDIQPIALEIPMQVHLKNGKILTRHKNLDAWIEEAEQAFGKKNQRKFWEFCFRVSQFVWETSLKQTAFPPSRFSDLVSCAKNATAKQFRYAGYSFFSTQWLLKQYDLLENQDFVDFVNEQLLITAQNGMEEVNVLFGATALCYTNSTNYYMQGGLINLVNPLIAYLKARGSMLKLREEVQTIQLQDTKYHIQTNKENYEFDFVVSGIPINNTVQIYDNGYAQKIKHKILESKQLNSAFQMGIGFQLSDNQIFDCIHHQIHLPEPLIQIGSKSIFISLNHPQDKSRCDMPNQAVASVSTHIADPQNHQIQDKKAIEDYILAFLESKGFFKKENIIYTHSSAQKSWQKWTGREFGFVGGYPQLMKVKPWQMLEARLDGKKAYLCGDTAYPGQGIPGTVLSGIIAFEKMKKDWKL